MDQMTELIIEMYSLDLQILDYPNLVRVADTTLVYEAILQKHGYNTKEFNRSLAHYLQKPEKLKKVMLTHRDHLMLRKNSLQEAIDKAQSPANEATETQKKFLLPKPYNHTFSPFTDTIALWSKDTIIWCKTDSTRYSVNYLLQFIK